MTERKILDDLSQLGKQLGNVLQGNMKDVGSDVEKMVRDVVQVALSKLDLVTREEFDVQTEVLRRTQQKLDALEHRLHVLESTLKD